MRANASVRTCVLAQPEFHISAFENLNSELHFPLCLFFRIRTGSASEEIQHGTLQAAEEIKI